MSRNTKNSIKLYDHLTRQQQAALAINAIFAENGEEVDRVLDAVPEYTYRIPEADYRKHVDRFHFLAMWFGMQFWRYRAVYEMSNHYLTVLDMVSERRYLAKQPIPDDADAKEKKVYADVQQDSQRLAGLIGAYQDHCTQHGLDFELTLNYLGIHPDMIKKHEIEVTDSAKAEFASFIADMLAV